MVIRSVVPLAAFILVQLAAAAGAQPAPAAGLKPPANEDCAACHDEVGKPFAKSVHAAAACVDCHQDLSTLQEFPHPEKLAKVSCASCHDDVATQYHDSIHAWAKEKAGLKSAPTCADCHSTHDIVAKADPLSRTSRANVPKTCGSCHEGIIERYNTSVHAAALAAGRADAPMCADCHTAHRIKRSDTPAWRLDVVKECGTCHAESLRTYRDTFHGQVTSLGFVRVAACADCHGAHEIHAATNPRSMVSEARVLETCQTCHPTANRNFVRYDPHADRDDPQRNPGLYYAAKLMHGLIITVFAFFGVHTALWLVRGTRARRAAGSNRNGAS